MLKAVRNFFQDYENHLVNALSEEHLQQLRQQEEQLAQKKEVMEQRITDIHYLFQQGFIYNKQKERFEKTEHITYGRYPGKYFITVQFSKNYPVTPPLIAFEPKGNFEYSEHIRARGKVCVSATHHGYPDTYWKHFMNIKTALHHSYHAVTGELERTIPQQKKEAQQQEQTPPKPVPIKGTIYEDISKTITKKEFVTNFLKPHQLPGEETWSWQQLAATTKETNTKTKTELIKYYETNKNKR